MKKLLLTILSVLMICGLVTTNVLANDIETVGDVLDLADFTIKDTNWRKTATDWDFLKYDTFSSQFKMEDDCMSSKKISVSLTDSVTADEPNYYITKESVTFTFNMDNGVLSSISVSGATGGNFDATYYPKPNLDVFLNKYNENFPKTLSDGWINDNNKRIYYDNKASFRFYIEEKQIGFDYVLLSKNNNGNYVAYDMSNTGVTFEFIMDENGTSIDSIKVNGFADGDAVLNGTYTAPPTVSDILAKSENLFPTTNDFLWSGATGSESTMKISSSNLFIECSKSGFEGTLSLPTSTIVTKNDNNYECVYGSCKYIFKITNNILTSIEIQECSNTGLNSEYKPSVQTFVEGPTEIKEGSSEDILFITDGDYHSNPDDVVVKVDGNKLTRDTEYSLSSGSTHVTLKGSYIQTLEAGAHTISIGITGYSSAIRTLSIKKESKSGYSAPKTGIE